MRLKLSFLLFFIISFVWSQTTDIFLTPVTSTLKIPSGVTSLSVASWGAGGDYSKILKVGTNFVTGLDYKTGTDAIRMNRNNFAFLDSQPVDSLGILSNTKGFTVLPIGFDGVTRTEKITVGQSFFKTSKTSVLERHRVWLNMTNTGGAFKQLLVGYIQGATNGYDSDFDGLSLNANPYIDFYSINSGNNLVIQGRALPFTDTDIVPLGYRTIIAGNFTIAIDHTDGQLVNQPIYLEDKATNTIHNLKQSSYTFTTNIGVFNNRFVLRYTNNTLGNSDLLETQKEILFWIDNNENIQISSNKEDINSVSIYDISGKLIYHKNTIPTLDFIINDFKIKNQVLIIKVLLADNRLVTKKMISFLK